MSEPTSNDAKKQALKHIQNPLKKTHTLCGVPLAETSMWSNFGAPIHTTCGSCREKSRLIVNINS